MPDAPLVAAAVAGVAIAGVAARGFGPGGLGAGAVAPLIHRALVRRRVIREREQLEGQLADVAETCAFALQSGQSMRQALETAIGEIGYPMRAELERLRDEVRMGIPLPRAIDQFANRIGTEDATFFATIVGIHLKGGGRLPDGLREVATTIRDRVALRREVRALTAQGRLSGAILVTLPLGFFALLTLVSPRDVAAATRTSAGRTMLAVGLALDGLAVVWIRRLLRVEP